MLYGLKFVKKNEDVPGSHSAGHIICRLATSVISHLILRSQ